MNSSETNSHTPMRYKHHSPVVKFFSKSSRTMLSRSSNCQTSNVTSHGHHSRIFKEANSLHVFPVVKTPPAKRFSRVVNPFEAALTDRLHLPLIGSPTLFQRVQSPQHSSTQFAWTIDDVSSLQPANVEPHETQFHDSPDPEYEAKAQSAISSYFKEQQIVPSPIDCPLRSQRIILSELSGNTPISKPGCRIRDNVTQTILSLPPKLPKELEVALAPYFFFHENQQCSSTLQNVSVDSTASAMDHDGRDASLRRKLFGHPSAMYVDDETFADSDSCLLTVSSPPPESPEMVNVKHIAPDEPFHNSKLSDSMDKNSFGSISPIVQSASPLSLKRKSRVAFLNSSKNDDTVSPKFSNLYGNYRCPKTLENFESPLCIKSPMSRFTTLDRSLARLSSSPYTAATDKSIESMCNVKISGLLVDTAKRPKTFLDIDLFGDETRDVDEDDMQISQLSAMSNISSESDTPRGKRRSASRKNLSQSFTLQCSSNNDIDDLAYDNDLKGANKEQLQAHHVITVEGNDKNQSVQVSTNRSAFCRTDSGFNEMTSSSTQYDSKLTNEKTAFQLSQEEPKNYVLDSSKREVDISVICCSTPSKQTPRHSLVCKERSIRISAEE